jgi:exodeoxyribonuclease VII small subunit
MDDQNTYTRLKDRLEDIVVQVRSKDVSLEKSLDLYEEALRLGGRCVEMIDRTDFTAEELASIDAEAAPAVDNASAAGVAEADAEVAPAVDVAEADADGAQAVDVAGADADGAQADDAGDKTAEMRTL